MKTRKRGRQPFLPGTIAGDILILLHVVQRAMSASEIKRRVPQHSSHSVSAQITTLRRKGLLSLANRKPYHRTYRLSPKGRRALFSAGREVG